MKKIPTLLVRDPDDRKHVLLEVTPGCEWVLAGEGVATRKYDGTGVMLDEDGKWWSRREVKPGKSAPFGFMPIHFDPVTGKTQGYEPIEQSPFYSFFELAADAKSQLNTEFFLPGTYELCGPKFQGNAENYAEPTLIFHDQAEIIAMPAELTIENIIDTVLILKEYSFEGIVWHHPDGRMAKLKARDIKEV